jgi:hypothetical protein
MSAATKLLVLSPAILLVWAANPQTKTPPGPGLEYTSHGQFRLPANYREWVYLSSGFDMTYNPTMQMEHDMFFGFPGGQTAKMIPLTENCYSCHRDHGAVDTKFVQFYPTLMPIAKEKGTVDVAYRKEAGNR